MFLTIVEGLLKAIKDFGLWKTLNVAILVALGLAIFNWKTIVLDGIEIYEKVQTERHAKEMRTRDELLDNLDSHLNEMRASVGADRLLYFEYHNSKENLVGIPFKYVDLVRSKKAPGVSPLMMDKYKDINAGLISELYRDLCRNSIIINTDYQRFSDNYPETADLFGSEQYKQVYVNLPGVGDPIGFILLEWESDSMSTDWGQVRKKVLKNATLVNAAVTRTARDL